MLIRKTVFWRSAILAIGVLAFFCPWYSRLVGLSVLVGKAAWVAITGITCIPDLRFRISVRPDA